MSSGKTSGKRKRVAILISGRGSNMAALIEAAKAPDYPAEIVLVVSNKSDAAGLEYAQKSGIETFTLSHKAFNSREEFDLKVSEKLQSAGIELVCLAGYMRLLSEAFCSQWRGRMINIHPSLLPAFKGLDTHRRALEAGVTEHGCTVHFVTPELDDGPVILQAKVPVLADDTEVSLAARVLVQEHRIYPEALAMLTKGQVHFA
ncbi:MAG: phosphoribosylglycinamide formyltransferase [Beijerinckiaceae bacterium]